MITAATESASDTRSTKNAIRHSLSFLNIKQNTTDSAENDRENIAKGEEIAAIDGALSVAHISVRAAAETRIPSAAAIMQITGMILFTPKVYHFKRVLSSKRGKAGA